MTNPTNTQATETSTRIRNINEGFGDISGEQSEFDSVEEMATAIEACGYMPADGLVEGRDYERIDE
jgi:hypothetical protein